LVATVGKKNEQIDKDGRAKTEDKTVGWNATHKK
jgi:hypothetical protein